MTRVVDFDAARAERKREPVTLRIGGADYTLTAGVPAGLALDLMRYQVEGTTDIDIPKEQLPSLAARLFGESTWQAILDDGHLDLEELPQLFEMTYRALNGGDDGPPNRAGRRTRAKAARHGSAGSATGR